MQSKCLKTSLGNLKWIIVKNVSRIFSSVYWENITASEKKIYAISDTGTNNKLCANYWKKSQVYS